MGPPARCLTSSFVLLNRPTSKDENTRLSEPDTSETESVRGKKGSRPYLTLLTISSKLKYHIQYNNKKKPEPFAPKPALGMFGQILPDPKVPSARHLPLGFFDFLSQRRKHKGIAAGEAQRQEQEPCQRPHGEPRWGTKLLMVGLFACSPGDWVPRAGPLVMSQSPL